MSAVDDHPLMIAAGVIGSPIGGAALSYATRVPTGCFGTICTYDYNPAAGAFATAVGWFLTGMVASILGKEDGSN